MGSSHGFVGLFLVIISMVILSSSSQATGRFGVVVKDGCMVIPSKQFVMPSERIGYRVEIFRFEVNDTICFEYNKGSDSLIVVNKKDYDSCNTNNPIFKMDGGDSIFEFDDPFFVISDNVEKCQNGEKFMVAVLALTHHKHSPAPTPSEENSGSTTKFGGVILGTSVAVAMLFNNFI